MNADHPYEEVIIAGFGGQGVLLAGKLLAQAAMKAGRQVTYMPSYGAEVRGGTANAAVVIAETPVACPVVSRPDSVIAMNKASLEKFGGRIKPAGLLVVNSSLIDDWPRLSQADVLAVPANEIAVGLGNVKTANMVALGAYLQKRGILSTDEVAEALPEVLAVRHHKMLSVNAEALRAGADHARQQAAV